MRQHAWRSISVQRSTEQVGDQRQRVHLNLFSCAHHVYKEQCNLKMFLSLNASTAEKWAEALSPHHCYNAFCHSQMWHSAFKQYPNENQSPFLFLLYAFYINTEPRSITLHSVRAKAIPCSVNQLNYLYSATTAVYEVLYTTALHTLNPN